MTEKELTYKEYIRSKNIRGLIYYHIWIYLLVVLCLNYLHYLKNMVISIFLFGEL
jgi:hypothetical protein